MSKNDITVIVNAAKKLIEANKRRGPGAEFSTMNEDFWVGELERAIEMAKQRI